MKIVIFLITDERPNQVDQLRSGWQFRLAAPGRRLLEVKAPSPSVPSVNAPFAGNSLFARR